MKNKKWMKQSILCICMAASLLASSVAIYAEPSDKTDSSNETEAVEGAESDAQTDKVVEIL